MSDPAGRAAHRVLVTGAGGFIGRHLARALLERGDPVNALDLHPPSAMPGLRPIAGDVGDPAVRAEALRGVETVFHLAACHLGVRSSAQEFERVNVRASEALVREAAAAGVRRFVHCSSVGVYGRIANPPADEESPCRPRLVYERTKLAGEQVALAAGGEAGVAVVVLRPAWVYGPGCARTEKLFRAIARGRFFVAGDGQGLRHGIHVSDMLRAFLLAAQSETAVGRVIVIGDAGAVTVRAWVDEIARLVGARRPRSVPLPVLWVAAVLCELASRPLGVEPPISRRTLEFFSSNTSFRIDRARALLGFDPRFDFSSGLAATHAALREARSCA